MHKKYDAKIELFEAVIVEESKWNTKGRYIILNILKKDQDAEEYWPRLTKEKVKNPHIKVDWSKWVDEDEEGGDQPDTGAWDPSAMQGFDMGGMGGMEDDSDDDSEEEAAGEVKDPQEDKDANADLDDLDDDEEVDPTKPSEEKKDE